MADRARNDADRSSWLRIAQSWLRMIPDTPEEKFDAEAEARGTGQPGTDRSQ
jgi:hypothetical protein